jgi:type I restriction enzyme R subunit
MQKEIRRAILDCSFGDKAIVSVVQTRFMELAQVKFKQ